MSDVHSYFYYKPVSNHNVIEHAVTFSDKLLCCDQTTTTTTATTSNHHYHNESVSYLVLAKNTILELCQVHKTNGVIHTIFQQNMFGNVMRIGCLIVGDEGDDERADHRREFLMVLSSNRDGGAFLHALTVNSASNGFEFFGDATIPLNDDEQNGDYNSEENDDAYFMSVDANGRAIVVASLLRSTIYVHPVIANFTGVMMTRMNNNNNNNSDEKLFDSACGIQVPMDKNASDGTPMVIWHIECLSSTETELYVAVVGTVNNDRNSVLIYRIDFRERTFEKVLYCDTKQSFYRSVSSYYEESLTQHVLRVPSQPNLLLIIHGSELLLTRWRDEHNGRVLPQLELLSRETYQPTTEMSTVNNDNNMTTHDDTEGGNENENENENTSNDENQTADSPTGNHYPRTNSGQCILTAAYDWSKDSISEHCSTLILTTENGTMFECRVEHKYSRM